MNDVLLLEVSQRLQDLNGKSPDKRQRHPPKIIGLNKLVQVDAKQLKRNQQVFPKHARVLHSNDVHLVVGVILLQMLDYIQFDLRLMLEFVFVSDYLDCDNFLSLMVKAFESLAETTLAQKVQHFESEGEMVF